MDVIRRGLQSADILLTTGGTSMGPTDLLKPVIERHFHGTIHFGRVAIKPGKPTTFATILFDGRIEKPVFALPGNPASALVTFHVFVLPALRRLSGFPNHTCQLPPVPVKVRRISLFLWQTKLIDFDLQQLMNDMLLDPRVEFHRVTVKADRDGLKAYTTGGQRSSRITSLSGANALVVLPAKTAVLPERLYAGTMAGAILIGEIQIEI